MYLIGGGGGRARGSCVSECTSTRAHLAAVESVSPPPRPLPQRPHWDPIDWLAAICANVPPPPSSSSSAFPPERKHAENNPALANEATQKALKQAAGSRGGERESVGRLSRNRKVMDPKRKLFLSTLTHLSKILWKTIWIGEPAAVRRSSAILVAVLSIAG